MSPRPDTPVRIYPIDEDDYGRASSVYKKYAFAENHGLARHGRKYPSEVLKCGRGQRVIPAFSIGDLFPKL